jgi:hypothetical protein
MFCNHANKKFVITNLENDIRSFKRFEHGVCPISKVVTFTHKQDNLPENLWIKILKDEEKLMTKAKDLFKKYDKDNNGTLDKKEIKSYFLEYLKTFGNIAFK